MALSKVTIFAALGANLLIAAIQFVAAFFSSSSALLSGVFDSGINRSCWLWCHNPGDE